MQIQNLFETTEYPTPNGFLKIKEKFSKVGKLKEILYCSGKQSGGW